MVGTWWGMAVVMVGWVVVRWWTWWVGGGHDGWGGWGMPA